MTLDEYINTKDRNVFWKLSSGEHQNLLNEAIERMVRAEAAVEVAEEYLIKATKNCPTGITYENRKL